MAASGDDDALISFMFKIKEYNDSIRSVVSRKTSADRMVTLTGRLDLSDVLTFLKV